MGRTTNPNQKAKRSHSLSHGSVEFLEELRKKRRGVQRPVIIVSLDHRNQNERDDTVLIVPGRANCWEPPTALRRVSNPRICELARKVAMGCPPDPPTR